MNSAAVGHQCPECVAEGRRGMRTQRTIFGGTLLGTRAYVTKTLIGINVAVQLIAIGASGGHGLFGGNGLFGLISQENSVTDNFGEIGYAPLPGGVKVPYGVSAGEYYRLFTSQFVHFGLIHLTLNMVALWFVGRALEAALGPLRFAVLYLVAGFGGGVAVYLFQPQVLAAGASGAIFGVFGALFVVVRRVRGDLSQIAPLIAINLFIGFAVPGISWIDHVGGLVTGAAIAFVFAYVPPKWRNQASVATVVGLVLVLSLAVLVQTAAIRSQAPAGYAVSAGRVVSTDRAVSAGRVVSTDRGVSLALTSGVAQVSSHESGTISGRRTIDWSGQSAATASSAV
jgi:membrane associated rhomboid family serine protease